MTEVKNSYGPEQSILSQLTDLKAKQSALMAEAAERRADILSELAGLCATLGPLTRSEIPDGVLRKRERTAKVKPAAKARKAKAGEEK